MTRRLVEARWWLPCARLQVRFAWVIAALEMPAAGVTPDEIAFACVQVGGIADHFDDELQGRFGGITMFGPQAGPVQ